MGGQESVKVVHVTAETKLVLTWLEQIITHTEGTDDVTTHGLALAAFLMISGLVPNRDDGGQTAKGIAPMWKISYTWVDDQLPMKLRERNGIVYSPPTTDQAILGMFGVGLYSHFLTIREQMEWALAAPADAEPDRNLQRLLEWCWMMESIVYQTNLTTMHAVLDMFRDIQSDMSHIISVKEADASLTDYRELGTDILVALTATHILLERKWGPPPPAD